LATSHNIHIATLLQDALKVRNILNRQRAPSHVKLLTLPKDGLNDQTLLAFGSPADTEAASEFFQYSLPRSNVRLQLHAQQALRNCVENLASATHRYACSLENGRHDAISQTTRYL
jgi:hypothetical protein